MGYTHYWSTDYAHAPADAFGRTLLDATAIIATATAEGIALRGWDGTGEVELTEGTIGLNGDAATDDDHETFRLDATAPSPDEYGWESGTRINDEGGWYWRFCKTARKPYDAVVGAILIRAKLHYGDALRVSSDGDWSEWDEARALYQRVFTEAPVCPFETANAP